MAALSHELRILSLNEVASFDQNGFLVLHDLFTPDEMEQWKAEARNEVEQRVNASGVFVWMCEAIPPFFAQAVADERLVSVLRQLIGPNIEFLSAKPVLKSGKITFASPWHQDYAYWGGATKYSVWIALDDATPDNGCLKVIPGSHRMNHTHAFVESENGFGNRILENALDGCVVVTVPLNKGGAIFFHDRLIHSSHPNATGQDRWAFIPTYRDASIPDESTVWKASRVL
ncbi:MAG: phytanoyl-CoA dioxygenase family protein [Candidatus Latescibacteria bacterium]|nr:phytanoyl-CoA dioxygenase family protein [Candidatus Latescibacterota bacterium]